MLVRFILCLLLVIAVFQWHTLRARQSWSATVDETCYLTCANNTVHLRRLDPQLVAFGVAPLPILLQWLPTMWNQPTELRNNYWQGTLTDPAKINRARWLTSWLVGNGLLITICGWIACRRGHYWGVAAGLLIGGSPQIITHGSLATTDVLATWMWLVCLAVYAWCWRGMGLITSASRSSRAKADDMRAKKCYCSGNELEYYNALAGLACGTAICAKYSGVALLLVWGIVWTVQCCCNRSFNHWQAALTSQSENDSVLSPRPASRARALSDWGFGLSVFGISAFVTCWAWHSFELAAMHGSFSKVASYNLTSESNMLLPAPLTAILQQQAHNQRGHAAMLFGEVSLHGWWYYFPALFALKSTPVELVLLLVGLLAVWTFINQSRQRWQSRQSRHYDGIAHGLDLVQTESRLITNRTEPLDDRQGSTFDFTVCVWVTGLLTGGLMLSLVRVQIGYRYALPLLVISMLLSIDWLAAKYNRKSTSKRGQRTIQGLVSLLCFVQLWSAGTCSPHYLSYFTPVLGGNSEAYRYVADSNIDWGQDLPALKQVAQELAIQPSRLALSYFGTADPRAYGVEAVTVFALSEVTAERFDYLAISVNHLYGLSATAAPLSPDFKRLRAMPYAARAGHSILIFSVAEISEKNDAPDSN